MIFKLGSFSFACVHSFDVRGTEPTALKVNATGMSEVSVERCSGQAVTIFK